MKLDIKAIIAVIVVAALAVTVVYSYVDDGEDETDITGNWYIYEQNRICNGEYYTDDRASLSDQGADILFTIKGVGNGMFWGTIFGNEVAGTYIDGVLRYEGIVHGQNGKYCEFLEGRLLSKNVMSILDAEAYDDTTLSNFDQIYLTRGNADVTYPEFKDISGMSFNLTDCKTLDENGLGNLYSEGQTLSVISQMEGKGLFICSYTVVNKINGTLAECTMYGCMSSDIIIDNGSETISSFCVDMFKKQYTLNISLDEGHAGMFCVSPMGMSTSIVRDYGMTFTTSLDLTGCSWAIDSSDLATFDGVISKEQTIIMTVTDQYGPMVSGTIEDDDVKGYFSMFLYETADSIHMIMSMSFDGSYFGHGVLDENGEDIYAGFTATTLDGQLMATTFKMVRV